MFEQSKDEYTKEQYNDNYISVDEAAQYLGIKPVTLRNWIKKTDIPTRKIGKQWKFKRSELDEWVNSGKANFE
ncbi:MAG: helix-turn-helix domain-containing protein [Lachnoclostridium sp.]|nr:helix-turn-helix domain-containing protein [Lachnoclostridium sp.]MDD7520675.1 helix-turn-helix domain-containing protein [Lachnoclostridium sp.]